MSVSLKGVNVPSFYGTFNHFWLYWKLYLLNTFWSVSAVQELAFWFGRFIQYCFFFWEFIHFVRKNSNFFSSLFTWKRFFCLSFIQNDECLYHSVNVMSKISELNQLLRKIVSIDYWNSSFSPLQFA